jgi:hypothetical protein
MPEYNEDQIKMTLTAAKDLAAPRNARRQVFTPRQVDVSERSEIRANRRATENLLASSIAKAGFEVDKFDELLAQNRSALRRVAERRKAEAVERSSSAKDTLRHGVESRRKVMEHLAELTPPESPTVAAPKFYELLDRPFTILPTGGVYLHAEQVESANSWAKFTVDSDSVAGSEYLSFYFLWVNPSDTHAVIDVDAYLVLNGFCQVESDGGFIPGVRRSSMDLYAVLHLLEWWNQPPTSPLGQVDQEQQALILSTDTSGWLDDDATDSEEVFRGYDLRYNLFLVPPHGAVVFEVALNVAFTSNEGSIHVDFQSGDFEVLCPGILIGVLA